MGKIDAGDATNASPSRLIVVVDNDAAEIRVDCARALRGAGFQVIEAVSGEEALTLALSERPDFVVYVLPTGDGAALPRPVLLQGGLH